MYSTEHAEIYDFIHAARGRDWSAEADVITRLIRERSPEAGSLLDVACGTGAHLERFAEHFGTVAGVELSPEMRRTATNRVPAARVHEGDMRRFELGRTFDAVLCMCFSLGYMSTVEELRRSVAVLVRHLAPGGVLVAEPWWFPEQFIDGFISASLAQEEGRAISRLSHSVRDGSVSRMTVRYTVAETTGIREFTEYETYSLFTREEYLDAFGQAGCEVEFLPDWPNGRGLFIAVRA
ncbi:MULTISPECIES: class I SAM-dependent methyltransferase [unclassified Streptomyces]|uniref:class I SAM-dependent methyltransferase n=1 Tax=Streptomyces sp. NBC_01116 TaxID=2903752 RepID=UPI003250D89D